MERLPHNRTYALAAAATTVSLAETIDMSNFAGGSYEVTGAQTITFFGTNQDDPVGKTFVKCEDEDGVDLLQTVYEAGDFAPDQTFAEIRARVARYLS